MLPDLAIKIQDAQLNLDWEEGSYFTKKVFVCYLKFKLNWATCILSDWPPYLRSLKVSLPQSIFLIGKGGTSLVAQWLKHSALPMQEAGV